MFKELLAIFVQFQVPLEQVSSLIFSRLEAEAFCKRGYGIYIICGFKWD